ncbi:MAG: sigma-70 family RNA polymerase sigma factor, partial [Clostridiales bacterium]|nr:sigma-70 family RNA polymerase sigma factor [Clostridiales bacterium]
QTAYRVLIPEMRGLNQPIRLQKRVGATIANELLMMLRSRKKLTHEVSMYEKIGTDQEGRELRLMDVLESEPIDVIEDLETKKNIDRMRICMGNVLNERERQVIVERYGLNEQKERTQREIAASLGISRSYVSRLEKRALEKLRTEMETPI